MPKMSRIKPLCLQVFGAWRNSQQRTQLSPVPGSNKLWLIIFLRIPPTDSFCTQWECWNIWEYLGIMTKGFNDERSKSQSLMHKLNFLESHPLRENPCWIRHRELSLCNDWRQPGTIQALHIRFQKNFLLWLLTRPVLPGTGLEGQKYILDAFWRVIWAWAALGLTRPKPKMHCPLA